MEVAVYELVEFGTCRTITAHITAAVIAQQIVGKSYRYRQLSVATRTGKKQCMRKTVLIDTALQLPDNTFLPYYILKIDSHQYIAFAIS